MATNMQLLVVAFATACILVLMPQPAAAQATWVKPMFAAPATSGSGIGSGACVPTGVGVTKPGPTCIPNNPGTGGAIMAYLATILQFLSMGIGIIIMLMMLIGGLQYIISAGDPAAVKAAKDRIVNAITALVLFILAYAILNFVVPGGIL